MNSRRLLVLLQDDVWLFCRQQPDKRLLFRDMTERVRSEAHHDVRGFTGGIDTSQRRCHPSVIQFPILHPPHIIAVSKNQRKR